MLARQKRYLKMSPHFLKYYKKHISIVLQKKMLAGRIIVNENNCYLQHCIVHFELQKRINDLNEIMQIQQYALPFIVPDDLSVVDHCIEPVAWH